MLLLSATTAVLLSSSCSAFMPAATRTSFVVSQNVLVQPNSRLYDNKVPFFASEEADTTPEPAAAAPIPDGSTTDGLTVDLSTLSEEEEVELLVQEEMAKTVKVSKLRTKQGVDYAPWMQVSEDDAVKVRQLMKEKASARRKREIEEQNVSGNLYLDSQAQELSGTGLNFKFIDGAVELEWATKSEKNTQGFNVRRRPAKTDDFSVVASFEDWGPLVSKGADGGVYRYLDKSVTPGGWVYRISEVDSNGGENDLCQCLVEVQTEDEQKAAVFAAAGFVILAAAITAGATLLDPMGGY